MKKFLRASLPALYLCNKNAALKAGARSGAGRAVITTFRLADAYGKDEYARRLLDEMIRLVAADGFEPKLTIE
jgi:hypothetical protein